MCNNLPFDVDESHLKIGNKMGLFHIGPESPGLVSWQAPGLIIVRELESLWRQSMQSFEEVRSPVMYRQDLFDQSGHLEKFADDMFLFDQWALKPMNCPGHIMLYKSQARSYQELPLRYCELGHVHRNEQSGSLNGLKRVRGFVQDDGHILCAEDDVLAEVKRCLEIAQNIYSVFNLSVSYELSLRPKQRYGSDELWDRSENKLREALSGVDFVEISDGGAFYGPKIDIHAKDSLGRMWQLGSVQLDYVLPERFDLEYRNADNKMERPVMIHRAAFGSLERFIGIILEHYEGKLPLWLAPVQLGILPVAQRHQELAQSIYQAAQDAGIRVRIIADGSINSRVKKLRENGAYKWLVIGDRESEMNIQSEIAEICQNIHKRS